jgi:HD-like signal output (HDOD) protein
VLIQDKTQQSFLEDVISSLDDQPLPLGSVAQAVIRLTTDPLVSSERLARAISADAGLAVTIIKKVNSTYYSGHDRISSLPLAIARLGTLTTRSLAVTGAIREMYRFGDDAGIEQYLWRHSMAVGLTCRMTARRAKISFLEEAYLSGLLHDVAKLVLVQRFYAKYKPVIQEAGLMIGEHLDVECEHLGFTHADLSAMILDRWQFSPIQVDAVRFHHSPEDSATWSNDRVRLAHVVCFANELAKAAEKNSDSDWIAEQTERATTLGFDFEEDDIRQMVDDLRNTLGDALQVFTES